MFERTQQNCDRYLDRIAHLIVGANGRERSALLMLAARLMRELEETTQEDDLCLQLVGRLKERPVAPNGQPTKGTAMRNANSPSIGNVSRQSRRTRHLSPLGEDGRTTATETDADTVLQIGGLNA